MGKCTKSPKKQRARRGRGGGGGGEWGGGEGSGGGMPGPAALDPQLGWSPTSLTALKFPYFLCCVFLDTDCAEFFEQGRWGHKLTCPWIYWLTKESRAGATDGAEGWGPGVRKAWLVLGVRGGLHSAQELDGQQHPAGNTPAAVILTCDASASVYDHVSPNSLGNTSLVTGLVTKLWFSAVGTWFVCSRKPQALELRDAARNHFGCNVCVSSQSNVWIQAIPPPLA